MDGRIHLFSKPRWFFKAVSNETWNTGGRFFSHHVMQLLGLSHSGHRDASTDIYLSANRIPQCAFWRRANSWSEALQYRFISLILNMMTLHISVLFGWNDSVSGYFEAKLLMKCPLTSIQPLTSICLVRGEGMKLRGKQGEMKSLVCVL